MASVIHSTLSRIFCCGAALTIALIGSDVFQSATAQTTQTKPVKVVPTPPKAQTTPNKTSPKPATTSGTSTPDKQTTPAKTTSPTTTPTNKSGIPEETQIQLVTQFSEQLATKIQNSSCPELSQLLDQVKASGAKPANPDSLVSRMLEDMKNNPKLKKIVVQKLGEPMINRLLDCNMVPVEALQNLK